MANSAAALPIIVQYGISEMMALLRGAELVIAADSGPLHLANAFGTPVVGLYGPTSPDRNGPYGGRDIVVRNLDDADTTYKRGDSYSEEMYSITVDQVMEAVEERLAKRALERANQNFVRQSAPQRETFVSDGFEKPAGSGR